MDWHGEEPWETIASVLARRTLNWMPWIEDDIHAWTKEELVEEFSVWLTTHEELVGAGVEDDPIKGAQLCTEKYYEFHTGWKGGDPTIQKLGLLRCRVSKKYTEAHQAENDQYEKDYLEAKRRLLDEERA